MPKSDNMRHLEKGLALNTHVTSKNRWFKSAMSESLGTPEHYPSEHLIHLYQVWAEGGAGIVVTGNVMVDRTALGEPGNVVLDSEKYLNQFEKWAQAGTRNETLLFMQLNHPGKQVIKGVASEAVAPSAVPYAPSFQRFFPPCRALTRKEIHRIISQFANAASLAQKSGFSGVQLHAAHGYLISQFLSPVHNRRYDHYGGTVENRFRFLKEIFLAVREATGPAFPISVKLNSADFMKAGFSQDDARFVIHQLEQEGADLIEISGGTYERPAMFMKEVKESTKQREAYFAEFANSIKNETTVPIALTGGFRSQIAMTQALENNTTDMIGVARPLVLYPDLPNQFATGTMKRADLPSITTGIKTIDQAALLELLWYARQLHRIGKGKEPLLTLSARTSLIYSVLKNGLSIFQKRRV
ncbi:NADH:flavin oxidoreductase/NADH oxidase family protein [Salisediminibacterium beveridgei]|uniref:NADH oxidase n=1 Tax=Salisediminibacterium beveridgei TaxID=632773 RepID=A0A1D7QVD2_9BACI|nr:NADH:flavin oxidoreductase/NADH oxidase family protein [Salisediminibacterium beveridgei]AOM82971.1 NADH oxidase [Salisediminibacterium beveridgei]